MVSRIIFRNNLNEFTVAKKQPNFKKKKRGKKLDEKNFVMR